jgi:hypothetical protein
MNVFNQLIGLVVIIGTLAASAQDLTATRLVPSTISAEKRFLFRIGGSKTNNAVHFSVAISPNLKAPSPPVDAFLVLLDKTGYLRKEMLANLHGRDDLYRYEFEIASNLVANSQFKFYYTSNDCFWFFPADFIGAATSNQQAGANGKQPSGLLTNGTSGAAASRGSP